MEQLEQKKDNGVEVGIEIPKFLDLTLGEDSESELPGQIAQAENISYISKDVLESASFDSNFHWPAKLPEGFDPERLIEEDKNPGLGVRSLHTEGITGEGIVVAIIDQNIAATHVEFKDNLISNREYQKGKIGNINDSTSMHGPAVASLFVGKTCGVAPGAELYYVASDAMDEGYINYVKALEDIIEYNKTHEPKVRVVSISRGFKDKKWEQIKDKAEKLGITVIDSKYFIDNLITGGGSKDNKDQFDDYDFDLWREGKSDFSWKERFGKGRLIIVPSDYRTMASRQGDSEYRHDAGGGWSWAIPYLSGVFTLALQVKSDLSSSDFLKIMRNTAGQNKNGFKVINPRGIIEAVKKLK